MSLYSLSPTKLTSFSFIWINETVTLPNCNKNPCIYLHNFYHPIAIVFVRIMSCIRNKLTNGKFGYWYFAIHTFFLWICSTIRKRTRKLLPFWFLFILWVDKYFIYILCLYLCFIFMHYLWFYVCNIYSVLYFILFMLLF